MRFIVVDDEPLALRDLLEILRKVVPGCEIVGCSTASEALKSTPASLAETVRLKPLPVMVSL